MMPHTPGPWWVETSDIGDIREIYDGFGRTATVYGNTEEAADNARLIANAPAMLSALRAALAAFQELSSEWRRMDAAMVDRIIATNLHTIEGVCLFVDRRTDDQ